MKFIIPFKWSIKKNWYIVAILTAMYTAIIVSSSKLFDLFIYPVIKNRYPFIHYDTNGDESYYKYILFNILIITVFIFTIILFFRLFGFNVIGSPEHH
jgi:hypothetical protein